MKICIFVASHIRYNDQNELLYKCLTSLIKQTKKADILVSVSFDSEEFKNEFIKINLIKFSKLVKFSFHKTQLFQMEHLYELTKKYAYCYDLIMFCDDDDTYVKERVERFGNAFSYGQTFSDNVAGVREGKSEMQCKHGYPEFWCYAVIPEIIITFFDRIMLLNNSPLKHYFADIFLRVYLRSVKNKNNKPVIYMGMANKNEMILYNYNIDNPNSIALTKRSYVNNIMMNAIYGDKSNENMNKLINNIKEKNIRISLRSIQTFCKDILYKDI